MSGSRCGPSHKRVCGLLFLVMVACVLLPGSSGQSHTPTQTTCDSVLLHCKRLVKIIDGYKEKLARDRLQLRRWSDAEDHFSALKSQYDSLFNYLKRVNFLFSADKPYVEHLRYSDELLRSFQFSLDQVQLDLSLYPERDSIHINITVQISRQLDNLHNEIRREALQIYSPYPSDLADLNNMLAKSYISLHRNNDRKARHFYTLSEILHGISYIEQVFINC